MKKEVNKSFSLDELVKISNGDDKFIMEMIDVFIKTTEEGIVEIEKSVKEGNYLVVSAIAHKIASPCRYMGSELLLNYIKEIENCAKDSEKNDNLDKLLIQTRNELCYVVKNLKIENKRLSNLINKVT